MKLPNPTTKRHPGVSAAWDNLPRRHCDDCGKNYKPVRPVKIKDVQPVFAAIPTQKGVIVRGGLFGVVRSLTFWNDTLTRAFNTFLQVALAAVGTGAIGITSIDYLCILDLATAGAVVSVLTSFIRATTPKK
jgi:hypothetical protein